MKCFSISNRDECNEQKIKKSISVRSSASMSSSSEARKSGSVSNSQDMSVTSSESCSKISITSLSERPNNLRVFTSEELKMATRNFSRSLMIGEGGFGCVYRGVIRDAKDPNKRMHIAVKQLGQRGFQGHKEWVTEVNVLAVVEHPNLVKLVGYCAEDDERGMQRLLVYEYMPNRSVQDHLSSRSGSSLPWITRLKIAQDAARGLAYLHEEMDFQVIFRDFKSSNILLDDQWNARLSDFGLARLGPSDGTGHVSTAVVGTVGYAAPEYIQTGRLTSKSDVWSYGVFLYEIITGRRPFDGTQPKNQQKLLKWVRPHLADMKKFELILDPRLEGKYSLNSAKKLATTANKCLVRHPRMRPKMSEVLDMVNWVVETAETGSPRAPKESFTCKDLTQETFKKGLRRRFIDAIIKNKKGNLFGRC